MVSNVSAEQIRAGRALLNWSARELAKEAVVAITTVQRLEVGAVPIENASVATVGKITRALEAAGVVFLPDGYGVTLADYAVAAVEAKKRAAAAKKAEAENGTIKPSKR